MLHLIVNARPPFVWLNCGPGKQQADGCHMMFSSIIKHVVREQSPAIRDDRQRQGFVLPASADFI
jgi:hypothetical protein